MRAMASGVEGPAMRSSSVCDRPDLPKERTGG